MQGQRSTTKTTLRSERRSTLKKYLTGPTLLEMFGYFYDAYLVLVLNQVCGTTIGDQKLGWRWQRLPRQETSAEVVERSL